MGKKTNKKSGKSYQAVRLGGPGAAAGAVLVAALPGPGAEAPSAAALRAAVDLGELLAVAGALAPAAGGAGLVAGGAVPLGLGELVHVVVLGAAAGDDLLPLDGLDVAQVVVVHDAHAALEDVWKRKEKVQNYLSIRHPASQKTHHPI